MDLSKIVNVPGKSGIFKLVSQSKTPIVESLIDGKRFPIFDTSRVSVLSDISIYTESEDKPLAEVFRKMFEKNEGKEFDIDEKKLRTMFLEVLPEYDTERVYDSNIKKVFQWYNILVNKGLVDMELAEYENRD
jgi:helix-turn-helix protein